MSVIKNIINRIDWYYNLYVEKISNYNTFNKWIKDDGANTLRFNYPLSEERIVIDAGGYKSEWSAKMGELLISP